MQEILRARLNFITECNIYNTKEIFKIKEKINTILIMFKCIYLKFSKYLCRNR